jgi:thymidylate kinase
MLDYTIGYWLKIHPKIVKQGTVVIFDRYVYDMALDPRRFRINLSERLIRWFVALAPKPDLILCLYAAPEVIMARKQELPMEEVRRQIGSLQAFAWREPRAMLICTEGRVIELREKVLQLLFDSLFCSQDIRWPNASRIRL